jgi:Carboxypeptidase regulatory-like domain/TonB dependent receptor-like, beta-barrel
MRKAMMRTFARRIIAGLVCIGLVAGAAHTAHAGTTGAIQGYVTDGAGHGIAGVSVTAAAPTGHFTTTSGSNGFYSLNGLPLDTYTLTFSKDGYQASIIPGITTIQDQPNRVNVRLTISSVKSLGRITVRSSSSLIQPTVTADTYVVNEQRLSDINGTPQDLNGFQAFNSLPGVTVDSSGYPTIRAGAENDVGYELDGVDNTEIGTGEFLNALTLNGARSVQLSTGGYDVSNGNTNSGVINEVIKRGTYPSAGQATLRLNSPIYGHELSFDFGSATPNNRFSYYFSFGGSRDGNDFGDRHTLVPLELGQTVFTYLNDDILNLFYHFGQDNKNELQYLANISAETFDFNFYANPPQAPYASNNGDVQGSYDPFGLGQPVTDQSNYITLFPGQAGYLQNTNQFDTQTFNSVIQKVNFKRQLTPSSFGEVRVFKNYLNWVDWYAYNTGSFTDSFFNEQTTEWGEAFDYTNQLSSKHEVSVGGDGGSYNTDYWQGFPSSEPFYEPLEDLGCSTAQTALTGVTSGSTGGCYIAPFNAALNNALGLGLPTNPAFAPLNTYLDDSGYSTAPVHKWDLWAKDRWQPNERMTVTMGLRWDQEVVGFPTDVAQQNTTYYIDDTRPAGCQPPSTFLGGTPCDVVTVPGQPIGTDVTRPQQISPRVAASYEATPRDTLRFSYGKNIEFVPLSALQTTYNAVPTSLQNCNIANKCFTPLPGFGVTNNVTNLYQQAILDLTTNYFAQYTPVLPQTAVNVDFSWEHEFGQGLELRLSPYYRKGSNYVVGNQPLLFTLASGTPVFGPAKEQNAGVNENTGVEFALQRSAQYGFSGLIDATYDNTLANYDGDFFPTVNAAALAANHFFHVTYVAPVTGTFNLVYNTRNGWHASTTISYESGYRYGVGTKTFVFGANGQPEQVLNTDLAATTPSEAYYFTDATNPGTIEHPNITASRGTQEGSDPGTLFGPPIATVNLSLSHTLGAGIHNSELGVRVENLLGNYSPTLIPANLYYVPQGIGSYGAGSGFNVNQCTPANPSFCEPFMYNQSVYPYEAEPSGPPRLYTFYYSIKY